MTSRLLIDTTIFSLTVVAAVAPQPTQPPANQTAPPRQPTEIGTTITGDPGTPPRLAVPDFLALSGDRETQEIARAIAEVLWDDLQYEREFYMIPRDTYKSIPAATTIGEPPFDRWRELGADGVVMGSVSKKGDAVSVEMRLFSITRRQQIYAREYTGSAANPRLYAHTISDEIHLSQRNLRGVARTKLTFVTDRDRERVKGTVEKRDVKEVYYSDYDGANQRRITMGWQLNNSPTSQTSSSRGFSKGQCRIRPGEVRRRTTTCRCFPLTERRSRSPRIATATLRFT
jgi:Tol biopolymer transport system component